MTYDQINGEESKKMLSKYYFFLHKSCSMSIEPIVTKFHNSSPHEKQCYSCI